MNSEIKAMVGIRQNQVIFSLPTLPQIETIIKKYAIDHNPSGRLYFTKSEGAQMDIDCLRFSIKKLRCNDSAHLNINRVSERKERYIPPPIANATIERKRAKYLLYA